MTKYILSVFFLVFYLDSAAQIIKTYYPSGNIESIGNVINGKKEGNWKWYYENGTILTSGKYKSDNEEGEWNWYYPNGLVWAKGFFSSGSSIGSWKRFDLRGKLIDENYIESLDYFSSTTQQVNDVFYISSSIGFHKNGLRHGRWKEFSNTGQLLLDSWYENGLKNGFCKETYFFEEDTYSENSNYSKENFIVYAKGTYKVGKREGLWTLENYKGLVIKTAEFNDDKPNGKWLEYTKEGTIALSGIYIDGKKNGDWIQAKASNGFFKGRYVNDKFDGECKWFYDEGQLKSIGIYVEGKLVSEWKEFYENGSLKEIGVPNGVNRIDWKFYYDNGRLKEEGISINGYKEGEWKEYYENGVIKSLGIYKNNSEHGIWSYYHENSNLWKKGIKKSYSEVGEWKYYKVNGELDSVANNVLEPSENQGDIEKGILSEGLIAYAKDNKIGFMDSLGNILLSHEQGFDYNDRLPYFKEGKCMVFKNSESPQNRYFDVLDPPSGKVGFIDKNFRVIIPPIFAYSDLPCGGFVAKFNNGYSIVPTTDLISLNKEEAYIIIDSNGRKINEEFDYSYGCYAACVHYPIVTEGILVRGHQVSSSGFVTARYDFIEVSTGKSFTVQNCTLAGPFSEGVAAVEINYEYITFIDRSGKSIMNKKFYTVKRGSNQISEYHQGSGCDRIGGFVDGKMIIHHFENEGYGREVLSVVDKKGNILVSKAVNENLYNLYDDVLFEKYRYDFDN
jgi:antitoxin component YwqK of YwqJK toxin-antitoxin module